MYELFTDRARRVMALANQEAQRFNHEAIGPEHILLGLAKECSGIGANALRKLKIELPELARLIEAQLKAGPDMLTMGKLPKTPAAMKVIESALEEARTLNHKYVGTEHLLLGMLHHHENVAAQVLEKLGVSLDKARAEVLTILGQGGEESGAVAAPGQPLGLHSLLERTMVANELATAERVVRLVDIFGLAWCLAVADGRRVISAVDLLRAIALSPASWGARLLDRASNAPGLRQKLAFSEVVPAQSTITIGDWNFTQDAVDLLSTARDRATPSPIGTDHIVLAAVANDSDVARVLNGIGYEPSAILANAERK